ncbi:MAG: GPP34 family phosphoprotein [Pseudomonadota bacterium]
MIDAPLTLAEEILLLMLDDISGRNVAGMPSYLAAGAALADLAFGGQLKTTGEGKKARFERVYGADQPTNAHLQAVLERLVEKGLDKKPEALVSRVANTKGIMALLRNGLVDRGILSRDEKKVLFFFTQTTYPTANAAPEAALKERLRAVIAGSDPVAPEDAVLITLAKTGNVLRRNFDKELLKSRKERLKEITSGENLAAGATLQAIEAVQMAIMVATIVPTVAITAS